MRNTVDIMGISIDNITMEQALEKVESFLDQNNLHTIYTPNSEIMMEAYRDEHLKNILCQADMLIADGAGVVLAAKILGQSLPEKVPGFDLAKNILNLSSKRNIRIFLFGAKPGVAETAGENIIKEYAGVKITGFRDGYFKPEDEADIIEQINASHADVLLVALGAPKQEKWIHSHKNELNVKVCIGVGGTFDIIAGKTKLAPGFFRKNGLEWLYRLCMEPWRFKRMLDLPKFIVKAFAARLKGRP